MQQRQQVEEGDVRKKEEIQASEPHFDRCEERRAYSKD